jgi:hypothetical protein
MEFQQSWYHPKQEGWKPWQHRKGETLLLEEFLLDELVLQTLTVGQGDTVVDRLGGSPTSAFRKTDCQRPRMRIHSATTTRWYLRKGKEGDACDGRKGNKMVLQT